MWHWNQSDYMAKNFAIQLIISLEKMGIKVFPDFNTCWHYDDKVAQKYLLEAIDAPLVPAYVFYDVKTAIDWAENTTFPKVFKLRGGASSYNVKLIKSKTEAIHHIKKAFNKGFKLHNNIRTIEERIWQVRRDKNYKSIIHLLKGFARMIISKKGLSLLPIQKGYVYFQDFVSGAEFDYRVVIIKDKAFAIKRWNRVNDFRASGSGKKSYNPEYINIDIIKKGFEINDSLNTNSIAIDFLVDNNDFKLIEISYAFLTEKFPGYWDRNLIWHDVITDVVEYMIETFVNDLTKL